jgi:hypothetical protein
MAWENGKWESEVKVVDAIRSIATGLQDWSVNVLGDLEKRLKKAKAELEGYRRRSISQEDVTKEAVLHFKVDRLEEQIDRDTFRATGSSYSLSFYFSAS